MGPLADGVAQSADSRDADDLIDDDGLGETVGDGRDLREQMDAVRKSLRGLKAKGAGTPQHIIDGMEDHLEALEKEWKDSQPAAPIQVRIQRAEAKLSKAVRQLEDHKEEARKFEDFVDGRRSELNAKGDEIESRIFHHRGRLDDLMAEAGYCSDRIPAAVLSSANAARIVEAEMVKELCPGLLAAAELLKDGTPEKEQLVGLLSKTQSMQATLRLGASQRGSDGVESFTIAEGDSKDGDFMDDGGDDSDGRVVVQDQAGAEGGSNQDLADSRSASVGAGAPGGARGRWTTNADSKNWGQRAWKRDEPEGSLGGASAAAQPPSPPPPAAAAAATAGATQLQQAASPTDPAPGAAPADAADTAGRAMVGSTPEEVQALVLERQRNGDWEAAQALAAQQMAVEAEQRRLHRAQELAQRAHENGVQCDPAAMLQWSLQELEFWAKSSGLQ